MNPTPKDLEKAKIIYYRDICDCHGENAADEAIEIIAEALTQSRLEGESSVLEKAVKWVMNKTYSTGHADTIEELLKELHWQVLRHGIKLGLEVVSKVAENICTDSIHRKPLACSQRISEAIRSIDPTEVMNNASL